MENIGILIGSWEFSTAIVYGKMLHFVVIWYIFPVFCMLYQEKSGNPEPTLGSQDGKTDEAVVSGDHPSLQGFRRRPRTEVAAEKVSHHGRLPLGMDVSNWSGDHKYVAVGRPI
jgi:hypothetical protein